MEKDKNDVEKDEKMIIWKPREERSIAWSISKPKEQSTRRIELYFTVKLLGGTVWYLQILYIECFF